MKPNSRVLAFAWLWMQASKVENMDHMTGSGKASQGTVLGHVWHTGLGVKLMVKLLKCCCRFYELITAHSEHTPCSDNAVGQKVKHCISFAHNLTHSPSLWSSKKHTFSTESRCAGNGTLKWKWNNEHYYGNVTQLLLLVVVCDILHVMLHAFLLVNFSLAVYAFFITKLFTHLPMCRTYFSPKITLLS